MATIIHERSASGDSSAGGWAALALVLLAVLVFGGLYFSGVFANGNDSNDINIDLPETLTPSADSSESDGDTDY